MRSGVIEIEHTNEHFLVMADNIYRDIACVPTQSARL